MSDDNPQQPGWFGAQQQSATDPQVDRRREQLLKELPALLDRQRKGRANSFYPYLLVRSVVGDRGDRNPALSVPFWESPDIWTAPGDPSSSPAIPPSHGGVVTASQPSTVYAHVWNLGFAPLAGIFVEFYWVNPSLAIDGANAHLIGIARCELAARGMQGSHKLVKCPKPWTPVIENGGHECLIVRVWGIGDPLGANDWQPWLNRHVAQRNVSVVADQAGMARLARTLGAERGVRRLQLFQVGASEGELAARIVAPHATVSPQVATHLLAELDAGQRVVLEHPREVPGGMLAGVHPLAAEGAPPAPPLRRAGDAAVVDAAPLLRGVSGRPEEQTPLAQLLGSVARLHPGAGSVRPPAAGEVQVLRLANIDDSGQLVGGYTLIVPGP